MTLYVVFRTYSSDSSSFLLTLSCPALSALSFVSFLEYFDIYRLVNYRFFSLSMAHDFSRPCTFLARIFVRVLISTSKYITADKNEL